MAIALTFTVLILALLSFIFEWLSVDITAVTVAIVLALLGLVTPEEAIEGFSNSATITVMAMFILSAGIERTGVIQVVSDFLLNWGGKNPTRQILVLGAVVGPITAFLNNTAVVAVFIPIVETWCRKQGISVSKLLIPLSYITVLGGTIAITGTSTNIVASSLSQKLGFGEFGLFQFTALGIITFTIGLIYLAFAAPILLSDRQPPAATPDLLASGSGDLEYLRRDKAAIAIAISLGAIVMAAFNLVPILLGSLAGVVLMIVTGVLQAGEIYRAVRWEIIFLLAGLFPLGTAMDKSGATQLLADGLVTWGGNFSGFWLLLFFYLATTTLTEVLSNSAAVILMIPVAVKVAQALSFNPLAFIFIVTFAASNSYLTPIGYQTNTMVYRPGGYKFLDFTKLGAPLNLILTFLAPLLVIWLYGLDSPKLPNI